MHALSFFFLAVTLCSLTLNLVFLFLIMPYKNGTVEQKDRAIQLYLRRMRHIHEESYWEGYWNGWNDFENNAADLPKE